MDVLLPSFVVPAPCTYITTGVAMIVTPAIPLTPPLEAVTVKGPPAVPPAVKSPLVLMLPPPLTVQLNDGWAASATPNWSGAVAVNCCVAPVDTVALDGLT